MRAQHSACSGVSTSSTRNHWRCRPRCTQTRIGRSLATDTARQSLPAKQRREDIERTCRAPGERMHQRVDSRLGAQSRCRATAVTSWRLAVPRCRPRGALRWPVCRAAITHAHAKAKNFLAQIWHRFVTGGMARLEGFEPPTNGFGSHYSIRLSYRRLNQQLRKFSNNPLTTCPVTLETGILEHE